MVGGGGKAEHGSNKFGDLFHKLEFLLLLCRVRRKMAAAVVGCDSHRQRPRGRGFTSRRRSQGSDYPGVNPMNGFTSLKYKIEGSF